MTIKGGREWFSAAEIVAAGSPELPGTVRGLNMLADAEGWRADPARARRADRKDRGWLYHISILPAGAQARLALLHPAERPAEAASPVQSDASKALWAAYEGLSNKQKQECQRRLAILADMERRQAAGLTLSAAVAMAATHAKVSTATIHNWRKLTYGLSRSDWLAALAPGYKATASFAECHPQAFEVLVSDWLRPERPGFSACYRRMEKAAKAHGWAPIPSERALRRRVEKEVPRGVAVLARDGKDKAKQLFPAQRRTRIDLHAMQAVNMDGHKFDVFVRFADGTIGRPCITAIQDLYSNKFVAWRHAETENKGSVRLAIGDMVERFGIPDHMVFDNGRAFASKWISGGTPNRYRFKIRDEEPQGLLTTLGVEIHWTKPYSGQSKPIERGFRDFCEDIAKHPFCAGAYTGNNPLAKPENYRERAIPFDAFRGFVDAAIAEHNARPGRRTEIAAGRSFDEAFAASLAEPSSLVRWPTEAQRSLWLLAAERVTAQKGSGQIHLYGNRYWAAALNQFAGRKVTVRLDPENLHRPLRVYTNDDRLIAEADCIDDTGFFDADGSRDHERKRNAFLKAVRAQQHLLATLKPEVIANLLGAGERPAPAQEPMPPAVKKIAVAGGRTAAAPAPVWDEEAEANFSRALALYREAEIIPFSRESSEDG